MDREVARWMASLFEQAIGRLDERPCVTIEVENEPKQWAQVLPELDEDQPVVAGFLLNFPYIDQQVEPIVLLDEKDILPPPGFHISTWDKDGFLTIWLRPDTPLIPMALFVGEVMSAVCSTPDDAEYIVRIETGF